MLVKFYGRYDTTTVIDLVHAADLYLWGGAGFSSGKVSYLWTQRDEMFRGPSDHLGILGLGMTWDELVNFVRTFCKLELGRTMQNYEKLLVSQSVF